MAIPANAGDEFATTILKRRAVTFENDADAEAVASRHLQRLVVAGERRPALSEMLARPGDVVHADAQNGERGAIRRRTSSP